MQNLEMRSEEYIEINDFAGTFKLKGENSELKTKDLIIIGSFISGSYDKSTNKNEIISLNTKSKNLSYINTNNLEMESTKAIYSKKDNIIELFENVKVVRGGETITGDYAKINTLDQSYKVSSKDSSKVKVLINTTNE